MVLPTWVGTFPYSCALSAWVFWQLRLGRPSWRCAPWSSCRNLWRFELNRARCDVAPWAVSCLDPSVILNIACAFLCQSCHSKWKSWEIESRYLEGGWPCIHIRERMALTSSKFELSCNRPISTRSTCHLNHTGFGIQTSWETLQLSCWKLLRARRQVDSMLWMPRPEYEIWGRSTGTCC